MANRETTGTGGPGRNEAEAPPPAATAPADMTTAQLKDDIDSGRTGDKVAQVDIGLSPLGTDDEAAGRPPSQGRIALARHTEAIRRWAEGAAKRGYAHNPQGWELPAFVAMILVMAVVLVGGIALVA